MGGREKLLIICGPTAVGKTAFAIRIAKLLKGELINADSQQVHKGLNTLTGKDIKPGTLPKATDCIASFRNINYPLVTYDLDDIPIWLYDIVDITEDFSVSHYRTCAHTSIHSISSIKKLPIVVGGTGLYIHSIISNENTYDIPPMQEIRNKYKTSDVTELQKVLSNIDRLRFHAMNVSDRRNPRRLIRAIEIGIWYSENKKNTHMHKERELFDVMWIGIRPEPRKLSECITERVNARLDAGVIQEVTDVIYNIGIQHERITSLGFKEIRAFIMGKMTLEDAKTAWIRQECQYAGRQMTWFRKRPKIRWFDKENPDWENDALKQILAWYN